jgi:asparagine synthetase B (glutamine-hydrolysing)
VRHCRSCTRGASISPSVVECMLATLSHRGPDEHNTVKLPGCDFGHAWLSIIDLESGSQPMQSADGSRTARLIFILEQII